MNVIVIKYRLSDGLFAGQTECPIEGAARQHNPVTEGYTLSTGNVINTVVTDGVPAVSLDFTGVAEYLRSKIDTDAGTVRSRFITEVPGQAQTYERKEREARDWTEGADEADFPFLTKEAAVRGVSIAQVQTEVMDQVNALVPLAAAIEAHRMNAKTEVAAALPSMNLKEMAEAAAVDWDAVLADAYEALEA